MGYRSKFIFETEKKNSKVKIILILERVMQMKL